MPFTRCLAVATVASGFALTGCYSAVAVPTNAPQLARGAPVEAELSPATTLRAADRDIQFVTRVVGAYIDWSDGNLLVSADRLATLEQRFEVEGATVRVPQDRIAALYTRELDRGRSTLLAAGIVAGVVVVPALFGQGLAGMEIWGGDSGAK
jgi:hypothetical protein